MPGELILLTGGNGYVGFATLLEALRKGYQVRAAVRRESAVEDIKRPRSIQQYLCQLSFIIVPDITREGAYDEAVKGVDYVLHIASSVPNAETNFEKSLIEPAVKGTVGILFSALREPSIKKVIITASLASVSPFDPDSATTFTADNVIPVSTLTFPLKDPFLAYYASKVRAHSGVISFYKTQKPAFSVVNVMPSYVIGRNELATTPETVKAGSNNVILAPIMGEHRPGPYRLYIVHIASLDPNITGFKNYGASVTQKFDWPDALEIVRRRFPEEVANRTLPLGGHNGSLPPFFDASATERAFNFKFKDLESAVVSLIEWYLAAKNGTAE